MSYSTFWEPPTRNFRERETAWINCAYYSHDSFCGCGNFAVHLLCVVHSFTRNSTPEAIALELKKQLQPKKCLGTGENQLTVAALPEPGENLGDVLEGLEPGDLEKLFEDTESTTTPPKEENPEG